MDYETTRINDELAYCIELDLEEIFVNHKFLMNDEVFNNLINNQQDFYEIINKICEAKCLNDKDMSNFKDVCKEFVEKCGKCGLPITNGIMENFILWSNGGLSKESNDGINKEMLTKKSYLNYTSDTDSPPFSILWKVVETLLKNINYQNDKIPDNNCLLNIKKEQMYNTYNGCSHIPYDKPLSELYVEIIPKEKLKQVKIEVGQHNKRFRDGQYMNYESVFMTSEFPIFLKRIAEYNIEQSNEIDKINIQLCLNIGDEEEKELTNEFLIFKENGLVRRIQIMEFQKGIEKELKNKRNKGEIFTIKNAKDIVGNLIASLRNVNQMETLKESESEGQKTLESSSCSLKLSEVVNPNMVTQRAITSSDSPNANSNSSSVISMNASKSVSSSKSDMVKSLFQ